MSNEYREVEEGQPVLEIPVERVRTDSPGRKAPRDLLASVAQVGQLVPGIVVRGENGTFDLWDGRDRLACALELGAGTFKAVVAKSAEQAGFLADVVTLAANVRGGKAKLSDARALDRLLRREDLVGEWGEDYVRKVSGLTAADQGRALALLRLAPEFQEAHERGELSAGAVKRLLKADALGVNGGGDAEAGLEAQRGVARRAAEINAERVAAGLKKRGAPRVREWDDALRAAKRDMQARLDVPPPPAAREVDESGRGLDPVALASAVRAFAVNRGDAERAALEEAAWILETAPRWQAQKPDADISKGENDGNN